MSQNEQLIRAVESVKNKINQLLAEKDHVIVAIDGRCASGKTTLAGVLQQELNCNVVHMDDFFLRPEQRTAERLQTPGENVDHERFMEEVLLPYKNAKIVETAGSQEPDCQELFDQGRKEKQTSEIWYRPYDCHTKRLTDQICIVPGKVLVVEGAYSCHKELYEHYDLHIFMDVKPQVQLERIVARNGAEQAKRFQEMWIPLEERYLAEFGVEEQCEMRFRL